MTLNHLENNLSVIRFIVNMDIYSLFFQPEQISVTPCVYYSTHHSPEYRTWARGLEPERKENTISNKTPRKWGDKAAFLADVLAWL